MGPGTKTAYKVGVQSTALNVMQVFETKVEKNGLRHRTTEACRMSSTAEANSFARVLFPGTQNVTPEIRRSLWVRRYG